MFLGTIDASLVVAFVASKPCILFIGQYQYLPHVCIDVLLG